MRWPNRDERRMTRFLLAALIASLAGVAAPAFAQPAPPAAAPSPPAEQVCAMPAKDIAALHGAVLADNRFKSVAKDARQEIVSSDELQAIWIFNGKTHPAFPSAVCRQVVNSGGTLQMDRKIRCEAGAAACAKLTAEQDAMDDGSGDGE
jgi:hypothetical protein